MANKINPLLVEPFANLELLARQVVEGFITGLHKSPFHGFSVEFAEHRLYNTGESTRHIDWKLYARSDKLFVKRYEEETNLRCQIIIDISGSMFFPVTKNKNNYNKVTFSIYCAAALIELLKRQRDAVGLSFFAEKIELHTPAKSNAQHIKMLWHELEKKLHTFDEKSAQKTFVGNNLDVLAENIHRRSLVVIFSDMFETTEHSDMLFAALQHLRHNKHEVLLFHVNDKKHEEEFDFENTPHRFIDMETGEELKLNPAAVKEKYAMAMKEFKNNIKLKCAQHQIDFIEADINEGFDKVLQQYLVKRSKLY
jgi:uncharacterized protein (DUF58 family)